jgi:tetratricopeptide (TPR) repeat protein
MSKMSNKQKKLAALAYIAEGNSFFEVKDFMGAIESYDKALEIKPFHAMAYLN